MDDRGVRMATRATVGRRVDAATISQRSSLAGRAVARWRDVSIQSKDATFAILWSLATQVELLLADTVEGALWTQSLAFAVMTLSLAWRRTRPLLAAVLLGAAVAVQTLLGTAEVVGGFVAMLIGTYSVASWAGSLRVAVVGGVAVLAGVATYPVVNDVNLADEFGNLAIFVAMWALGRLVRTWRRGAAEAEARAAAAEQARAEHVRAAVAEERGRIARELHDVVAHGVTGMVLQAGAARQLLERDPSGAAEPLLTVEAQGRQALAEMRRLLGLLRRDDPDLALAPPLQLSAIDELLEETRRSGLTVTSRVEGEERSLSAGLQVSAYRIVQEALTNVVKHADATRVEVVLRYDDDALDLRVTDDGRGRSEPTASDGVGTGHGLVGMRERTELFGGSFAAGPLDPSGWSVRARLQVEAES